MWEHQMTVQVDSAVALGPRAKGRAGAQGARGPGAQAWPLGPRSPCGAQGSVDPIQITTTNNN